MMAGFSVVTTYVIIDCFKCGALFGLPNDVNDELLARGRTFYCPNGHGQHYTNSLQKQLQDERDRSARLNARLDQERAHSNAVERSRRATKGQLTKVKKRVANGVCPCCNRSFADLAAHMKSQHPNYVEEVTE
jgi:hypothetical protein